MFKFAFVLLLVSLSVYSQPRPTGGPEPVAPDMGDPSYSADIISSQVSNNVLECGLEPKHHKTYKNIKQVHELLVELQIEYLVKTFPSVKVDSNANICEASASHVNPQIICLFKKSEDPLQSFATNDKSGLYLKKKFNMSQDEATKAMEFFKAISKPLAKKKIVE